MESKSKRELEILGFITWARQQDHNQCYDYRHTMNCVVAQYLKSVHGEDKSKYCLSIGELQERGLFYIASGRRGPYLGGLASAAMSEWTIGKALARAEEELALIMNLPAIEKAVNEKPKPETKWTIVRDFTANLFYSHESTKETSPLLKELESV